MGPDELMRLVQGMQAAAAVKAGVELGLFDALAAGHATPDAAAAAIEADPRGTRILLDALAALGLVTRSDDRYALAPVADAHLVTGRPADMGGTVRLFASDHMWDAFKGLGAATRRGGTLLEAHAETPQHPFWTDFARWTGGMAGQAGAALAEVLAPWAAARRPLEILDVACGTGLYGYSLAARQPHARVTSLDWPNVLEVTRGYAERMGVADRVQFLPGDCFTVPLGGTHDLVILSHIFHHFDVPRCAELMGRMAAALKPGGRMAIHEFVPMDEPAADPAPHLFSTVMLAWTRHGEAHDLGRYRALLRDAGMGEPEVHASGGLPTKFLVAEKR